MSLTSKQIDELRVYAKDRKGELAKLITDAADTIEELSAKLHASQMERSSQYYHDGWIPCSERFPQRQDRSIKRQWYLTTNEYGNVDLTRYEFEAESFGCIGWYSDIRIIAWMLLPEPYKEGAQDG